MARSQNLGNMELQEFTQLISAALMRCYPDIGAGSVGYPVFIYIV